MGSPAHHLEHLGTGSIPAEPDAIVDLLVDFAKIVCAAYPHVPIPVRQFPGQEIGLELDWLWDNSDGGTSPLTGGLSDAPESGG